ncbi:lactate permease [Sporosarcina sp. P3]|uniref:L-lactate permease n=1 Tax=Sporosarcina sp. P3 TaxID=2048245 RepID=UPI000C16C569|nr:L-lactate permease [Sporosarcina sp. P3]PID21131.1 lactate permease [Sporosarcina sp. P3]
MNSWLLLLLGVFPIIVLFFLLIILRWSAKNSMIVAFLIVLVLSYFVWEVPVNQIVGASFVGIGTTFNIGLIIFGALLLLNTLKESGALGVIRRSISSVTADRRIQVIIILWIFGAFLEGAAGFGSTGAVIGSMLIGLGFPAMAAALMVMIFQSFSVTFGAAGTPVIIGINDGLGSGNIEFVNNALHIASWDQFLLDITAQIATIHGVVGIFVPLFMVVLLAGFFGEKRSFREGFGAWKFAIFGGLCVAVPYVLSAYLLGPEFPSLLGGLIGIIPAVIAAKKGWFMPKDTVWQFPKESNWEDNWKGIIDIDTDEKVASFSVFKSWIPYILTAFLLFTVNAPFLPFSAFLKKADILFTNILGTDLGTKIGIFTSPGTIFIVVSLITLWVHGMNWSLYKKAIKDSSKTVGMAIASLIFAVPMVQVFLHSGGGAAGYESIPATLASGLTFASGNLWGFVAPVIGALGAFLAGSNTFSNLMFSEFQLRMALNSNLDPSWVISLQAVGAGAGNMFSVHNVITAAAAVGLVGREGEILRKVFIPAMYYILLTGAIGTVILLGFGLNIGSFVTVLIFVTILVSIWVNKGYYKKL